MSTPSRAAGVVLVLIAALAFSTSAVFGKLAYGSGAEPLAVLLTRFVIAAVLIAAVLKLRGARWPQRRQLVRLITLGAVCYAAMSLSFFLALERASAGLVALLLYLYPAIVAAASAALGWERFGPLKLVALALALAGMFLTVGGGSGSTSGVAFGIAAAVLLATYMMLASRLLVGQDALAAVAPVLTGCALTFTLLALATQPVFPTQAQGWLAMVGLALVSTVIAMLTLFAALKALPPSDASTLMTVEPAFTLILAAALLGERITWMQTFGAALILGSVALLARRKAAA